jgi:hypothetical protein
MLPGSQAKNRLSGFKLYHYPSPGWVFQKNAGESLGEVMTLANTGHAAIDALS